MDAIKALCDIRNTLRMIAASYPPESATATGIMAEAEKLDRLTVMGSITIEALNPAFDEDYAGRGYLQFADIAFTVFMKAKEDGREGKPNDWFNDTWPLVQAGIAKIKADCIKRVEYAAKHQPLPPRTPLEIAVRNMIFNLEQTPGNEGIVNSLRSAVGLAPGERP